MTCVFLLCRGCGIPLKLSGSLSGRKVRCARCGVVFAPEEGETNLSAGLSPVRPEKESAPDAASPGAPQNTIRFQQENTYDLEAISADRLLRPPQAADELGRLGSYRVLKVLGQGGMGRVYLAEDTLLQRSVALKVLLPRFASDPRARQRFLREARAVAALEHDHVVTIHQVGEDNGLPFLTMTLLRGESLEERLQREQRLSIIEVLRIGWEIAEGLAAAHEHGLIHRDIKPSNVWLQSNRGNVKILDFGLVLPVGPGQESPISEVGAVVGSPAYMAPEQALCEKLDGRCDLFSLGCVLYRMLTGNLPFHEQEGLLFLSSPCMPAPQAPDTLDPDVPTRLSDLVMQLLARDRERRPESAQQVAEELRTLCGRADLAQPGSLPEKRTLPKSTPHPDRSRRGRLVVLGLLVLLSLGGWLATVPFRAKTGTNGRTPGELEATLKKEDRAAVPAKAASRTAGHSDPDRRAAEWVLSIGGEVCVSGSDQKITAAADLPRQPFRLLKVILYDNPRVTDAGLAHFRGCKDLSFLALRSGRMSDAGLEPFKSCKNLTHLDLSHTQVSDAGLAHFQGCTKLAELGLQGTPVTNVGLAAFGACKELKSLCLDSTRITDAGLAHFQGCKKLEVLSLSETPVDTGLAYFKSCKKLTWLNLRGTRVSDASLAHFAPCWNLSELNLANTEISDAGLAHFKDCWHLTRLNLSDSNVSGAGLATFRDCRDLTQLFLRNLHLSDAGLEPFKNCKKLTHLDLTGTRIGDHSLAHFKGCRKLLHLHLADTRVTDAGLAVFADCKELTTLCLDQTRVCGEGLKHLQSCNNLQVLTLSQTPVNTGMAHLTSYRELRFLNLTGSQVSDASLVHLSSCQNLSLLRLDETDVTDEGLAHLKKCPRLSDLGLTVTKVTAPKVQELKRALPTCRINWDGR